MPNRHSKPLTTFSSSFAQTLRRENLEIVRYRFASRLGQGISEAIPEIQTRRMTAALAEIAVCFAGNPRLGLGNRLNDELCLSEEIVKPPAGYRISASVDDRGCLDVIDGRNAAAVGAGYGFFCT